MQPSFPIRVECPPGACVCQREQLLNQPGADLRILMLTREEEKKLLERLERISSLQDLEHLQQLIEKQLGVRISIAPGSNEVRTMRGIQIDMPDIPGLCRKTRQSIPAAIRKGLERSPEIAWALLDAHDLFGMPAAQG
ncbi:hypothetical protein DZC30_20110 [Comamonas testosteroni]|uniref:Ribosomal protein S3AE n=1 Tax=Comamonas testosteroni TaxID=285 RepID=A0A373F902_COMTE|nr:hypothetical protein [Comamonas testosteroni]RGE40618.1 hypothetical protein DZC30_20110 [Comamonas testosteroni]